VKIHVQGQVALVEGKTVELRRFPAEGGKVENGNIEEIDPCRVTADEVECMTRRFRRFRRGSEQEIDVGADSRFMEPFQCLGGALEVDALVQAVQDMLIPRFHSQFQHDASGGFQGAAETGVFQFGCETGESVPGDPRGRLNEGRHHGRAQGIVEEVDQDGFRRWNQGSQLAQRLFGRNRAIWIFFGFFRTEGASPPVTSPGGAVREDESRSQVIRPGEIVVAGRGF